jgi:mono/diheme cytochrome c family protein
MNPHSIFSRSAQQIIFACLGILLCISLAVAQKESAIERTNRLADAALAQAPEKARARQNPFEGDAQATAAGGKLFEQHCADCHGEKAGGTRHGISLLREAVQQATPGALFWILTNGVVRHGMPVWSKLPEPERWQIVTFLESLKSPSLKSRTMEFRPEDPRPRQPARR